MPTSATGRATTIRLIGTAYARAPGRSSAASRLKIGELRRVISNPLTAQGQPGCLRPCDTAHVAGIAWYSATVADQDPLSGESVMQLRACDDGSVGG